MKQISEENARKAKFSHDLKITSSKSDQNVDSISEKALNTSQLDLNSTDFNKNAIINLKNAVIGIHEHKESL